MEQRGFMSGIPDGMRVIVIVNSLAVRTYMVTKKITHFSKIITLLKKKSHTIQYGNKKRIF